MGVQGMVSSNPIHHAVCLSTFRATLQNSYLLKTLVIPIRGSHPHEYVLESLTVLKAPCLRRDQAGRENSPLCLIDRVNMTATNSVHATRPTSNQTNSDSSQGSEKDPGPLPVILIVIVVAIILLSRFWYLSMLHV
jgi:hypothetical protein